MSTESDEQQWDEGVTDSPAQRHGARTPGISPRQSRKRSSSAPTMRPKRSKLPTLVLSYFFVFFIF